MALRSFCFCLPSAPWLTRATTLSPVGSSFIAFYSRMAQSVMVHSCGTKWFFFFLFKLQIISCVTLPVTNNGSRQNLWVLLRVSEAHAFIPRKPRFLFCNDFFLFVCTALRNVTSLSCELSYSRFEFFTSNMT